MKYVTCEIKYYKYINYRLSIYIYIYISYVFQVHVNVVVFIQVFLHAWSPFAVVLMGVEEIFSGAAFADMGKDGKVHGKSMG